MQEWSRSHGIIIIISALSLFQYILDYPQLNIVILLIIKLHSERMWVSPTNSSFKHFGWIYYQAIHLSHALHSVIRKLVTSSCQSQVQIEWIYQLCHQDVKLEEHYACQCMVVYEIRGRYHDLVKQGFGPLRKVMEQKDEQCLGLLWLEIKRHRKKEKDILTSFKRPK